MKRFGFWVVALALCAATAGRAQDAATEERLKQLSGKVEDLIAGQEVLRKRIEELAGHLESLREQQNRPTPNYAGLEDVKGLAKAIEQVDRKRIEDNQKIREELLRLIDAVKTAPVVTPKKTHTAASSSNSRRSNPAPDNTADEKDSGTERGTYYTVAKGDTLTAIIAAFREQHVIVTEDQILKANPGLKPDSMPVRKKLFIPLPKPPKSAE